MKMPGFTAEKGMLQTERVATYEGRLSNSGPYAAIIPQSSHPLRDYLCGWLLGRNHPLCRAMGWL